VVLEIRIVATEVTHDEGNEESDLSEKLVLRYLQEPGCRVDGLDRTG